MFPRQPLHKTLKNSASHVQFKTSATDYETRGLDLSQTICKSKRPVKKSNRMRCFLDSNSKGQSTEAFIQNFMGEVHLWNDFLSRSFLVPKETKPSQFLHSDGRKEPQQQNTNSSGINTWTKHIKQGSIDTWYLL